MIVQRCALRKRPDHVNPHNVRVLSPRLRRCAFLGVGRHGEVRRTPALVRRDQWGYVIPVQECTWAGEPFDVEERLMRITLKASGLLIRLDD